MKRIIVWSFAGALVLDKCTPVNVFSAFNKFECRDLTDGVFFVKLLTLKISD
jgi:hypothetical protein